MTTHYRAAAAPHLLQLVAQRFPLVPRVRPVCRVLTVRVARVRDLARQADQRTSDSLLRAAEAHNLAALILSDTGLPDDARALCRQQFDIFRTAGPLCAAHAKLALQPLVNLGRLLIRDGHGNAAYHLLNALFEAVRSQTDAVVDGQTVNVRNLVHDADRRAVTQWLWTILLADGTRALTRAGRWSEALQHAEQHNGIGQRLLDGRQVAVLARCAAGDHHEAHHVLATSTTAEPWEQAAMACLKVVCLTWSGHPTSPAITPMLHTYLALEPMPEHAVFYVRLGLTVIDLADGRPEIHDVATSIEQVAVDAADAYAAHDILSSTKPPLWSADKMRTLTELLRASGLGAGSMPPELLDDLMESIDLSEAAMAHALATNTTSAADRTSTRH